MFANPQSPWPPAGRPASGILRPGQELESGGAVARGNGFPIRRDGLAARAVLLMLVLAGEALAFSMALDTENLTRNGGVLSGLIGLVGPWAVRGALVFFALFATFGWLQYGPAIAAAAERLGPAAVGRAAVTGHILAVAAFAGLSSILFGTAHSALPADAIAAGWLACGLAVVVSIALALVPRRFWRELARATGNLWAWSLAGAMAACASGELARGLWRPMSQMTFELVRLLLAPFVTPIVAHPQQLEIGTRSFQVEIAPQCSGLEGAGLLLIFTLFWLWLFRRELRFPQALALIPGAIALLFLLNSARIAGLILIGNAGAPDIALGGFHSQAGWIAFNSVAFGTAVAVRRFRWFALEAPGTAPVAPAWRESEATTAYLMPFLAILGAGMVAHALSGNFEWLYWLRFPAALSALWLFRRTYPRAGWKFDWFAPAVGGAVFLLWAGLARMSAPAAEAAPAALLAAAPAVRWWWIAARIGGAVVVVPIAEELAFRGYLLRRLAAADFERISLRTASAFAILGSSLVFGLLHGRLWFAGILAGVAYAWCARRRGRLADAMVAHGVTNALLAAYVLYWGQWQLW